MPISYSLKEAAMIADVPERVVRKAIEVKSLQPRVVSAGRAPRYRFDTRALLYLKLIATFPLPLGRADKQALRDIIEGKRTASGRWSRAAEDAVLLRSEELAMRVDLKGLREMLTRRLRTYRRGRRRIVSDPAVLGGEPVFAGTRIPLSHIAALLAKNVPLEEIEEDYPALRPTDLQYAAMVAGMKPNPGRPRNPLVLRRDGQPVVTEDRTVDAREATAVTLSPTRRLS